MGWEPRQTNLRLDRMEQDCLAKEMGRLGAEGTPDICKSSGWKNGMGSSDNPQSLDKYCFPQIYLASQHQRLGKIAYMEQSWYILDLEGTPALLTSHQGQPSMAHQRR